MSAALPHRIRRLHWQARAPTAEAAFALRAQLRELSGPALAALERSLSAHAPDDRVIHLPRLELHLRLDQPLSIEDLAARIAAAASAALDALPAEAGSAIATPLDTPRGPAYPATQTQAASLAIDDALTLDTLLREAPATLRAAITDALARTAHLPDDAPPQAGETSEPPVALEINGQTLHLPLARLRQLARQLISSQPAARQPLPASIPTAAPSPLTEATQAPGQPPAAAPGHHRLTPDAPSPGSSATSATHAQAQLATYLLTGSLDWTLAGLESDAALQVLRAAATIWVRLGVLPACIFPLPTLARIGALARWLPLLPRDDRQTVIASRTPAPANACRALTAALRELLASLATPSAEAIHAQALWLTWSMEPEHATDEAHASWRSSIAPWVEALLAGLAPTPPWTAVLASLRMPVHQPIPTAATRVPRPAPPHSGEPPAAPADTPNLPPATAPQPQAQPQAAQTYPGDFTQRHAPKAPAGLVVPAAGLVLLHPYLPRLLDATGLYPAGNKGAIPDPALPRAAALLHWLASGREVVHEFELPFIKLLLGRAPDAPLSHTAPALSDTERDEASALLEAVLAHWQALRGTSADGLRTSFLQRRGWIDRRDDAWLLRVEPESFDMLLGLLPWGLGLVRLPWMTQALFTEWSAP